MACAASTACGADDESAGDHGPELQAGRSEQALGLPWHWEHPWPSGNIPFCYQPLPSGFGPANGSLDYFQTVALIEEGIAEIERVPDAYINFVGGGTCDDWDDYVVGGPATRLRIAIGNADVYVRYCEPGTSIASTSIASACNGVRNEDEPVLVYGKGYSVAGIRHLLGHVLGFDHELQRADAAEDGSCDPQTPPGSNGGITEYDHDSIMSATYCHFRTELSELDKVGLAYAYPNENTDRFEVVHPFTFAIAGGFVTGAGDTAKLEFSQRLAGVMQFHYDNAEWSRWTGSSWALVQTGSFVTLGDALASEQDELRAEFSDGFGRSRVSPTTIVRQDQGLAAALLVGAL